MESVDVAVCVCRDVACSLCTGVEGHQLLLCCACSLHIHEPTTARTTTPPHHRTPSLHPSLPPHQLPIWIESPTHNSSTCSPPRHHAIFPQPVHLSTRGVFPFWTLPLIFSELFHDSSPCGSVEALVSAALHTHPVVSRGTSRFVYRNQLVCRVGHASIGYW
jgi:hypothetical protein